MTNIAETVVSAVLRAITALAAGLLLAGGMALLLWTITPGTDQVDISAVGVGAVVFAASLLLPVAIEGTAITIAPLLLTIVIVAIIATSAGRGRVVAGRLREALHGLVFLISFTAAAIIAVRLVAPAGTVTGHILGPLLVGTFGVVWSLATRDSAWCLWWGSWAPSWLQASVRAAMGGLAVLVASGAAIVTVSLLISVGDVANIAELSGGSFGDTAGIFMLSWLLLPNAAITAIGYLTGAGFVIGTGTYAPLAVHSVELPAIPLLAAVPSGPSQIAFIAGVLALLAVLAAVMTLVRQRVRTPQQRLAGMTGAAVLVAAGVAGLLALASGGIAEGAWARIGAPIGLTAAVVAGVVVVPALLMDLPGAIGDYRRQHRQRSAPAQSVAAPSDMPAAVAEVDSTVDAGSRSETASPTDADAAAADVDSATELESATEADTASE